MEHTHMMQVFIKITGNKTMVLNVEGSNTIGHVKDIIHNMSDVPPLRQRLVFALKELDDSRTLTDYNIQKNSTIYMTLRNCDPREVETQTSEDEHSNCTVCCDEITQKAGSVTLNCGHTFHLSCFASLTANGHAKCPNCRKSTGCKQLLPKHVNARMNEDNKDLREQNDILVEENETLQNDIDELKYREDFLKLKEHLLKLKLVKAQRQSGFHYIIHSVTIIQKYWRRHSISGKVSHLLRFPICSTSGCYRICSIEWNGRFNEFYDTCCRQCDEPSNPWRKLVPTCVTPGCKRAVRARRTGGYFPKCCKNCSELLPGQMTIHQQLEQASPSSASASAEEVDM